MNGNLQETSGNGLLANAPQPAPAPPLPDPRDAQIERVRADNERLRMDNERLRAAAIQARGALRFVACIDVNSNPYGTTCVALGALDAALAPQEPGHDR